MRQLIQFKMTSLLVRNSTSCSPCWLALLLIPLVLTCFAPSPSAQAVSPPPDGGYAGANTAEGTNALFSNTTGTFNTAIGSPALFSNTGGALNTATGVSALFSNLTGSLDTATGVDALFSNTFGAFNTATGVAALFSATTGSANTATGFQALFTDTTGGANTAVGFQALFNNTGSNNIGLGTGGGFLLTTGNNNIDIGHNGVAADNNTIRIGTAGTQMKTFIAGIRGVTVTGGETVVIDANGQLGSVASAMTSNDPKGKVCPVRYEAMIRQLQKQQKQIENLTAKLKEQAAQIQKVSAQLEVTKPAPQTVVNNQ